MVFRILLEITKITLDRPSLHIALLTVLAVLHSELRLALSNLYSTFHRSSQAPMIRNHLSPMEILDTALSHKMSGPLNYELKRNMLRFRLLDVLH